MDVTVIKKTVKIKHTSFLLNICSRKYKMFLFIILTITHYNIKFMMVNIKYYSSNRNI